MKIILKHIPTQITNSITITTVRNTITVQIMAAYRSCLLQSREVPWAAGRFTLQQDYTYSNLLTLNYKSTSEETILTTCDGSLCQMASIIQYSQTSLGYFLETFKSMKIRKDMQYITWWWWAVIAVNNTHILHLVAHNPKRGESPRIKLLHQDFPPNYTFHFHSCCIAHCVPIQKKSSDSPTYKETV